MYLDFIDLALIVIVVILLYAGCLYICSYIQARRVYTSGGESARPEVRYKDLVKHPRSKSEALVIKYIEDIVKEPFPTAYPTWLVWKGARLELDGFNGRIGLEFSGPMHTRWLQAKEPYSAYFERLVRDTAKRRLCAKHGVLLIVVDTTLPAHHWRKYVLSRLYDAGEVTEEPSGYIREQAIEPYRNTSIENELGLGSDMKLAEAL